MLVEIRVRDTAATRLTRFGTRISACRFPYAIVVQEQKFEINCTRVSNHSRLPDLS
jgi:hypothetical protein